MQEEAKDVVKKKRTIRTNVQVDTATVGLSGKQLSVAPYCSHAVCVISAQHRIDSMQTAQVLFE